MFVEWFEKASSEEDPHRRAKALAAGAAIAGLGLLGYKAKKELLSRTARQYGSHTGSGVWDKLRGKMYGYARTRPTGVRSYSQGASAATKGSVASDSHFYDHLKRHFGTYVSRDDLTRTDPRWGARHAMKSVNGLTKHRGHWLSSDRVDHHATQMGSDERPHYQQIIASWDKKPSPSARQNLRDQAIQDYLININAHPESRKGRWAGGRTEPLKKRVPRLFGGPPAGGGRQT